MIVLKHPEDNLLLLSKQMTNNMCIFAVLVMTRCSSSATIILSEKKASQVLKAVCPVYAHSALF